MDTIPLQPLILLFHSFMKATQQDEDAQIQAKQLTFNVPINTTYFTLPNQTMNHT